MSKRNASVAGPYAEVRFDDLVRVVKALRPAISADETRAHLGAILFEVGADVTAVATNGHWLARWESVSLLSGSPGQVLVPLSALKQFLAIAKDNTDCALVRILPNRLVLPPRQLTLMGGGETVIAFAPVTSEFPQWRSVLPPDSIYASSGTPRTVGVAAPYLVAVAKAFAAAGAPGVSMEFGGETDPIRVTAPDDAPNLLVVLMPRIAADGAGAYDAGDDEDEPEAAVG